jgi:hypothetical protein
VKAAVEQIAREEGISMNQFVAPAVAEKLTAMRMASFFAQRRSKADFDAFASYSNEAAVSLLAQVTKWTRLDRFNLPRLQASRFASAVSVPSYSQR